MVMSTRFGLGYLVIAACAACGPETTSFRTTDKGDASERVGPPAAAYDVRLGDPPIAQVQVHVWSNGGYLSPSGEPMTHVGFELRNTSTQPVVFDGDALALAVFDSSATALPPSHFTTITPLGPSQIQIQPGATVVLGSYFTIPVRPRAVDSMRIKWSLRLRDKRYVQITSFTRDDDAPGFDNPRRVDPQPQPQPTRT
jgi:hypothetical protein